MRNETTNLSSKYVFRIGKRQNKKKKIQKLQKKPFCGEKINEINLTKIVCEFSRFCFHFFFFLYILSVHSSFFVFLCYIVLEKTKKLIRLELFLQFAENQATQCFSIRSFNKFVGWLFGKIWFYSFQFVSLTFQCFLLLKSFTSKYPSVVAITSSSKPNLFLWSILSRSVNI